MFLYNKLHKIKGRNKIRPQYPVFRLTVEKSNKNIIKLKSPTKNS